MHGELHRDGLATGVASLPGSTYIFNQWGPFWAHDIQIILKGINVLFSEVLFGLYGILIMNITDNESLNNVFKMFY